MEKIFTSMSSFFDSNDTSFTPDEQVNTVAAEWISIDDVELDHEANYDSKILRFFDLI